MALRGSAQPYVRARRRPGKAAPTPTPARAVASTTNAPLCRVRDACLSRKASAKTHPYEAHVYREPGGAYTLTVGWVALGAIGLTFREAQLFVQGLPRLTHLSPRRSTP